MDRVRSTMPVRRQLSKKQMTLINDCCGVSRLLLKVARPSEDWRFYDAGVNGFAERKITDYVLKVLSFVVFGCG